MHGSYYYACFFESFWTPIEIGLTLNKHSEHIIIPILCNVAEADIAQKFPMILTLKYLKLDVNNINTCVDELYNNIIKIKEKNLQIIQKFHLKSGQKI